MKIRKIDLPDEIRVVREDVTFVFRCPTFQDRAEILASFTEPAKMEKAIASKLIKVEGLTFEDGAQVSNEYALRLPWDFIQGVFIEYVQKFKDFFYQEADLKKEPSKSDVSDS